MTLRCDVLVVGAGSAGVPAAVAAAREGAGTVIVERNAFPGGCGVTDLHWQICGLYLNGSGLSDELLNPGLTGDICNRLGGVPGVSRARRIGRVDVLPYDSARFSKALAELLKAEDRVQSLFNTTVQGVSIDGRRITSVETSQGDIVPRIVVDCSGDGVVIRSSPLLHEVAPENERQLAGCTVRVNGLKGADETLAIRVPYVLRLAEADGKLPAGLRFSFFTPGDVRGEGLCKLSLLPGSLHAGMEAGEAVSAVLDCLKSRLPEFRNAAVVEMSTEVMEREGARLKGEYTLTEADVLSGRKFPDGVARNAWPIEMWDQKRGPKYKYLPAGEFYEIPLRCLRAAAVDNLLCAGRCISVSSAALGSTRVMGTCMALGEAAGKEAAGMVPGEN